MTQAPVSVSLVIIAKNEERTIGKVIDAAKELVTEIIVVDSGSSDKTCEIASERGARVIFQEWLGYAAQKNFAIDQAQGDWILSLDADEILSPALVEEMKQLVASPGFAQFDGYKIPRVLYIGEKAVLHGGFYPDAQLRLIKRGSGRFGDRLVHEAIKMDGPKAVLKNHMDHYSYRTVDDFAQAMEKYARLSAKEFYGRIESGRAKPGFRTSLLNLFLHPYWTFFQRFVLRGGFKDGSLGLKLALIYSDYVRKKILYLRELLSGGAG
jgi:glycosyltransferase involved in cell wall biosynthesis